MRLDLIVLYTDNVAAAREFYGGVVGLPLRAERHGGGPEHFAAELADGGVLELYPASARRPATGSLRLGFTVEAGAVGRAPGEYVLSDPDGRAVILVVRDGAAGPRAEENCQM